MSRKSIAAVLATAAVVSIGALGVAAPASADPASGTYPPIAGTGSDTTQDVLNALADPTLGSLTDVGSWDATGTSTIKVTSAGASFARPNGSGNGIKALSRSIDGSLYNGVNITGQLDFARSSRGPAAGTDLGSGGALTYIPFARDAVTYAYNGAGLATLTPAQLKAIYLAPTLAAAKAAAGGVDVYPILPQAGSGTRSFFLGAIGTTEAALVTAGSWALQQTTVQENKADGIVDSAGEIVPFSAASWVAQYNNASTTHIDLAYAAGTRLGSPVVDELGVPVPATTLVSGVAGPNADYYSSAFGRDVYNVVQTSRVTATSDPIKARFVGPNSEITSTDSDAIITRFGFQVVSYAGDTDIAGFGDITGDHAKGGALE